MPFATPDHVGSTTTHPLPTDSSTILRDLAPDLPARGRAQLTATDLCLHRGGRQVVHGATLRITAGSRLAVVGENGRGKTTLLRALAGRLSAESGEVRRLGTLGLVDQDLPAPPGRRVGHLLEAALAAPRAALHALDAAALALADGSDAAESAYSAALEAAELLDAWDAERRLDRALAALDADHDPDRRLGDLSVGQRYRIRLACLLGTEHDFLLLDEPTNHLDADALGFLTRALREHRGGVVLVSHDRALLTDVATDVLDLEPTSDGRPRVHGHGYADLAEARRRERERWQQEYDTQQAERTRLERAAAEATSRLSTGWRPDKGTGKHQRQSHAPGLVQAVRRRQDALESARVDVPPPPPVFSLPELRVRPGRTLVRADGVRLAGRLEHPSSLALEAGSRLVLTGPNGAGKSTLLNLLAGRLAATGGEVRRAEGVRVALLTQEGNDPDGRSAAETYRAHSDRLVAAGLLSQAEQVSPGSLGLLDPEAWRTPTHRLSTGQQRRLDLAMQLVSRPDVLLLDEPTNHLSATLVDELTAALESTSAAVVIATHDRQLLRDTAGWPRLELGMA